LRACGSGRDGVAGGCELVHEARPRHRIYAVMAGATGALFVGVKARGAVFSGQPIEAGDHEHVAGVELIEGAAHVGAVDLGSATQGRRRLAG